MPKFYVYQRVDAYQRYCKVVEASSPEEAEAKAKDDETLEWEDAGVTVFDDREYYVLNASGNLVRGED